MNQIKDSSIDILLKTLEGMVATRNDLVSLAVKELRIMLSQDNWQPIETAPKDGTDVILWDPALDVGVTIGSWSDYKKSGDWWMEGEQVTGFPSHWMPLPEPPKP